MWRHGPSKIKVAAAAKVKKDEKIAIYFSRIPHSGKRTGAYFLTSFSIQIHDFYKSCLFYINPVSLKGNKLVERNLQKYNILKLRFNVCSPVKTIFLKPFNKSGAREPCNFRYCNCFRSDWLPCQTNHRLRLSAI